MTRQRFFEDLEIGHAVTSREITVTENKIIEFAKNYDPEWFHTDPEKAKDSIFGALIASGVHTFALFRRLDHEMNHDVAAICGLEWTSVRFPKPVYANDRLVASSAVTDKRLSKSKPDRGVVTYKLRMTNQDGDDVMIANVKQLVNCRRTDN